MRRLRLWRLALTMFAHGDEIETPGPCPCGCGKQLVSYRGETFTVRPVTAERLRKAREARVA